MTAWYMRLITCALMSLLLASCLDTAAKPTAMPPDATTTPQRGETLVSKTPITPLPRPSPTATEVPELPLITAARILWTIWSPDGELLAYWTLRPEEIAIEHTYPPGSLWFLDLKTNTSCRSPVEVERPYFSRTLLWTRDGRAWVVSRDGRVFGFFPCQVEGDPTVVDVPERIGSVHSPPGERMLVMGDGGVEVVTIASLESAILLWGETTWFLFDVGTQEIKPLDGRPMWGAYSPDGMNVATTEGGELAPDGWATRWITRIRSLATGEVRAEVEWDMRPAKGEMGDPVWLNADRLLEARMVIGGPLLLTTSGRVIEVASEFFHTDCELNYDKTCYTLAAPSDPTGGFHIVMEEPAEGGVRSWLLYHSESGEVERLPALDLISFSPDGQWLAGVVPYQGGRPYQLWVRKVDPIGAAAYLGPTNLDFMPLAWSPDSSTLAYGVLRGELTGGVAVLMLRTMDTQEWWSFGDYLPGGIRWLPDGRRLIVDAYRPSNPGGPTDPEADGLFVLDLP